jgi:CheY-like chemotaxis protein
VRRILVVEESETMREILSSTLDRFGEPVEENAAATGFETPRCRSCDSFDRLVTDPLDLAHGPSANGVRAT